MSNAPTLAEKLAARRLLAKDEEIKVNLAKAQENQTQVEQLAYEARINSYADAYLANRSETAMGLPLEEEAKLSAPKPSATTQAPEKKLSLAEKLALKRQQVPVEEKKEEWVVAPEGTEIALPQIEVAAPIVPTTTDIVAPMQRVIHQEIGKLTLAQRLEMKRATQEAIALEMAEESIPETINSAETGDDLEVKAFEAPDLGGTFSLSIKLNDRQVMATEFAENGKNFCLIGAAGTGKTTTQRTVAAKLVADRKLRSTSFKIKGGGGSRVDAPSIAFVAFTNRASANLARAVHKDPVLEEILRNNIMTIHSLLEFEPEEYWDQEADKMKFRFAPKRTAHNPLTITHLVIEEASMVGLDLWEMLFDALPLGVQIIFIGDINQLPPVFGPSILNYALVQLPVVELTEVYRQQEGSTIIENAHRILAGNPDLVEGPNFKIVRGKSPVQVGQGKMAMSLAKMFEAWYDLGYYDPADCMILSPWNKKDLGTINMNHWIAQFLGKKRGAVVHEVLAGFSTLYLAEGDRVMFEKQDAVITKITINGMYHGKEPQAAGTDLSRFGVRILGDNHVAEVELEDQLLSYTDFSVDELEDSAMERKQQASHLVTIMTENGQTRTLSATGDFGDQVFSLGYVLTVHKAQGCEWKRVFIILHKDHAVSLFRELLYTAETRSREECILIAKDDVIKKAIASQRIKGNTLEEKIEYFNSGLMNAGMAVSCVK